ncbi:MAG: tetratricopeptide repeat protein [Phycisphaerales bacterium]|nr:MAG: tetratricopeptide repeat protein [Phycisphaerales bacterium]
MGAEVDITRKGILVGLLDTLYDYFKDDLPGIVRFPTRLALAVAHKASPDQRAALKSATKADIEDAILHSSLAAEYAAKGMLTAQAIDDAVRHLQRAFVEGIDAIRVDVAEVKGDTGESLAILRRLARESRERGDLDRPFTLTPPRNIPPRNKKFAGRRAELDEVHRRLCGEAELGVTQETAAHGYGGSGKTAVAIEYAWTHLDDYPGGVFFALCDADVLTPAIAALAPHLWIEDAETQERTALLVKMRLEGGPPALLIMDNVRDTAQFNSDEWTGVLPGGSCRRLITTRSDRLGDVDMYPIQRLPRDQGIELLAKFRPDAADPVSEELLGNIVDFFDGLAVGLTVVGVYMSIHPELPWTDFAAGLENKGLGGVRTMEDEVGILPQRYNQRVDAIFDDTFDVLPAEQQRALQYAALLPEDSIVRHWLTYLLERDDEVELPDLVGYENNPAEPTVSALLKRELLRPVADDESILDLHCVLRQRLCERLGEDEANRDRLLGGIVNLAEARGKASYDTSTYKTLRGEHAWLFLLANCLIDRGRSSAGVGLLNALNLASWKNVPLAASEPLFHERPRWLGGALDNSVTLAKSDPPQAPPLWSNLVAARVDVTGLQSKREHLERMIARMENCLDPDDPDLAASYSELAAVLQDLGDLSEAHKRMEQALAIDQKHFESDHPTLATSYSDLATVLWDLGDLSEARKCLQRAVAIWEKDFPLNEQTLVASYHKLALILWALGDSSGARDHLERVIAIDEKRLDPKHPTLAISYTNLAGILHDLGDLPGGRQRIEQAIAIDEKHFDPDHPSLATSYNNLAHIELADGNREKACELWQLAYRIFRKHFDDDHPNVKAVVEMLQKYCGGVPEV